MLVGRGVLCGSPLSPLTKHDVGGSRNLPFSSSEILPDISHPSSQKPNNQLTNQPYITESTQIMKTIAAAAILALVCLFATSASARIYYPHADTSIGYACCVRGNPNAEFCKNVRCSRPMSESEHWVLPQKVVDTYQSIKENGLRKHLGLLDDEATTTTTVATTPANEASPKKKRAFGGRKFFANRRPGVWRRHSNNGRRYPSLWKKALKRIPKRKQQEQAAAVAAQQSLSDLSRPCFGHLSVCDPKLWREIMSKKQPLSDIAFCSGPYCYVNGNVYY